MITSPYSGIFTFNGNGVIVFGNNIDVLELTVIECYFKLVYW